MSPASPPRPVRLDPSLRIVAGDAALHLVGRNGAVVLKGKGLPDLHQRLAPVLDGRFTEEKMLAAAGPQAPVVRRYLESLREAGALITGAPPPSLPAGVPEASAVPQTLRLGRLVATVELAGTAGAAPDRGAIELAFLDPAEFGRRLVGLGRESARSAPGRLWVVTEAPLGPGELVRRAAVARHLLAIEVGKLAAARRSRGPRLTVFSLAASGLALARRAGVAPPREPLSSLPAALGLVRTLDRPQLPLVWLAAELPGLAHRRVGVGLDYESVAEELLAAVLGPRALAVAGASAGVQPPASQRLLFARSALELAERTLASRILAEPRSAADVAAHEPVDLLRIAPPSRRIEALQAALRRRIGRWPARLDHGADPLLRIESPALPRPAAALGLERALALALLARLAAVEPEDRSADGTGTESGPGVLLCVPPSAAASTRRRWLRRALLHRPDTASVRARRVRVLGRTVFWGPA